MDGRLPLRVARRVVHGASRLAPRRHRDRFAREWEGELSAEASRGAGWRLVWLAVGAFADARAFRTVEREETGTAARGGPGGWIRDVLLAVRSLRRDPLFTSVAVVTLALGIGGASALFTLIDRVVLAPLPYPEPERLVRLDNQVPGVGPEMVWNLSTAQYVTFADEVSTLEEVGIYRGIGGHVLTPSGARQVPALAVTASMMPLLGARATVGRVLSPSDDTPASTPVALVSRGFWERELGSDPSIVGRALELNGSPVEVVGVLDRDLLPPGWPASQAPSVWLPMRIDRSGAFWNSHINPGIGRLAPGATAEAASEEIDGLTSHLIEAFPDAYPPSFFDRFGFHSRVRPLSEDVKGDLSATLWIVLAGTGLVLLVACANVANLFLARRERRKGEAGIRAALGAGGADLARYVLAEALVLSLLGAVFALLVGVWAVPGLTSLAPTDLAQVSGIGIGRRTVLFTSGLSVVVGLALAVPPLLGLGRSRGRLTPVGSGTRGTAAPERQRLRTTLVVTQVALALTLVVTSGLLLRTLAGLRHRELGFEPGRVLLTSLYPSPARYSDGASLWNLQLEVLRRVKSIPGVEEAGLGTEIPVYGGYGCTAQGFEDQAVYDRIREAGFTSCAGQENVTPGYFEALGIPLLEGRLPTDADMEPGTGVAIVSRAFADRFWPGEDPIGRGVGPNGVTEPPFHRVVGVVGDVLASTLEGQPPLSRTAVAIYYARPGSAQQLVVKAGVADPVSLFPAIRRAVAEVDPEVAVANETEMGDIVAAAIADLSFLSLLLGIAAATALLLAAVGLYGVLSYVVSRRTREIGMRMAIGARPAAVQRLVVGQSLAAVSGGLILGVFLALATTRVMRGFLVGVATTDPAVYAAAAGLLATVALLASWVPAVRASRIDPSEALRRD